MCIQDCDSMIDALCVSGSRRVCMDFIAILRLSWFRFVWVDVVVSAGFKTIRVDLHRFCWNYIFFIGQILHDFNDLADRSGFGSIWEYFNLVW